MKSLCLRPAMLVIAVFAATISGRDAAGQPVKPDQVRRDTSEVSRVMRALWCPADAVRAVGAAVQRLNALPERAGAKPILLEKQTGAEFIAAYGAMDASLANEVLLRRTAVRGLLSILGPEVEYVEGAETKGEGLIYVSLRQGDPYPVATRMPEGGSAEAAGLLPGDKLLSVDGRSTAGLTLRDAASLLRGDVGSLAKLVVERASALQPLAIDVVRVKKNPTYQWHGIASKMVGRVGVISLPFLNEGAAKAVAGEIRALRRQNSSPIGYVIDLRNNAGGRLDEAFELADLFMSEGVIGSLTYISSCPEPPEVYRARRGDETDGAPIVLLINAETGNGAEIFASALAQSGRAKVAGEPSAGMVSIRVVIPLPAGRFAIFPSSEFTARDGARMQGVGLKPTYAIVDDVKDPDASLKQAIALIAHP